MCDVAHVFASQRSGLWSLKEHASQDGFVKHVLFLPSLSDLSQLGLTGEVAGPPCKNLGLLDMTLMSSLRLEELGTFGPVLRALPDRNCFMALG